jgi:hypothetical protein
VAKAEQTHEGTNVLPQTETGAKVALWWLRHFDSITHFWTGFSWVWVTGLLLCAVTGQLGLQKALFLIFVIGVIANTGVYCGIKTLASYLKHLRNSAEKEEAHELMTKIIRKRMAIYLQKSEMQS